MSAVHFFSGRNNSFSLSALHGVSPFQTSWDERIWPFFFFFFFTSVFTLRPLNKTDSYCSYPSQILLRTESDGVVLNFCMHRELSYEEDLIKLLV